MDATHSPTHVGLLLAAFVLALLSAWPAAAAGTVVTLGSGATPSTVTVAVGEAVTIRNQDDERHRLRARDPEDVDTSDIEPGGSAVLSFPVAGSYVLVDERTDDPAYSVAVEVRGSAPASPQPGGSRPGSPSATQPASTTPPPSPTSPPRNVTVTIPDDLFSPRSVTVAAGGTVTWENRDGNHTVTADDGSWDSGVFDSGRFQHTFRSAGTYGYRCLLHPEMRGTVRVVGAAAAAEEQPDPGAVASPPASASASAATPVPAPRRGGLAPVAAIMFAFMLATFVVGRVTARP